MIGYVTVGTNDYEKALAFYNALFAVIGIVRLWQADTIAAWGLSGGTSVLPDDPA